VNMSLTIRSSITVDGFAIEICGPTGAAFSMAYFATGCKGYYSSGEIEGKVPEGGRYVHLECAPFAILGVGISDLAIGLREPSERPVAEPLGESIPEAWSGPFQGRSVPAKQTVDFR
jgi:hypothetical protein